MSCCNSGGNRTANSRYHRSKAATAQKRDRKVLCGNCGQNLSATYKAQLTAVAYQLQNAGRTLLHVKCPRCHKETVIPVKL
jgi:ribosomal protein S27AE